MQSSVKQSPRRWVSQAWLRKNLAQVRAQRSTEHPLLKHAQGGASLTEYLLTSPDAFGVETATPAQRAICRILDGVPLGELAEHPDVLALVGGNDAVDALPNQRNVQPVEFCLLAAIRAAKTFTACAAAIRMAMTVDVSGVGKGETVRVPITSLTLDKATDAFRILSQKVSASKVLSQLIVEEPKAASILLRHPSGRPIEIAIAAGKKAGGSIVGIWLAGAVFDEAPRMNGADDAVVNLDHARTATLGRLLPGAQALYIGSPWAPYGPVYDMVQQGWAKPDQRRVVLRGTGPMLNPVWWTPERCAELLLTPDGEASYQTDVLGEFADPEAGLIPLAQLKQYTRKESGDIPRQPRAQYCAAIDPSDGTEHGNPWTLVVVERATVVVPIPSVEGDDATEEGATVTRIANRFSVVAVREWRGKRPAEVVAEVAQVCRSYGLERAVTDQFAGAALADIARAEGFELKVVPWTSTRKVQAFTNLATLIAEGLVELHPDPQFQRDILSVRKRKTQQGVAIVFPHMGGGRHCDYAPALASAVEDGAKPQHRRAYTDLQRFRSGLPKPREF
jgi:hypothetical protein